MCPQQPKINLRWRECRGNGLHGDSVCYSTGAAGADLSGWDPCGWGLPSGSAERPVWAETCGWAASVLARDACLPEACDARLAAPRPPPTAVRMSRGGDLFGRRPSPR